MSTTRKNERSWVIVLISEINSLLNRLELRFVSVGGETTISSKGVSMFPDLLLYGDRNQTQILQGWEIKLPDTPITNIEFIQDAERKARALNLNSFVIWNFSAGVLYIKNSRDTFEIYKSWMKNAELIRTRMAVETHRTQWFSEIQQILVELNQYFMEGKIKSSDLGEVIADHMMTLIVQNNQGIVAAHLRSEAIKDTRIRSYLSDWYRNQKNEYLSEDKDPYSAYAKVIVLNWVNKIVFAHLIKGHHNSAKKINELDQSVSVTNAVLIFEEITRKCDFFNIFQTLQYGDHIPDFTWNQLVELSLFLRENGIENLSQSTLQLILENTVISAKRTIRGQFATPPNLAKILANITIVNWNKGVLDPCCGTGTIAAQVLNQKIESIGIEKAYKTNWASDKYSFPLQISNISLTKSNAINMITQIFQANVLDLAVGNEIPITNPQNGELIIKHLPEFDTIISNLPFVNFELVDDTEKESIREIAAKIKNFTHIRLSKRSDYYAYITFALWDILAHQGRLGIIISNSWLGTEWGRSFVEALLYYYRIQGVFVSGVERWFNTAKVVTTALILEKKEITCPNGQEEIKFGIVMKTLEELQEEETFSTLIDSVHLNKEIDPEILKLTAYKLDKIKNFNSLGIHWNAFFYDIEWLNEIRSLIRPITDYFDVFRGERRGWDAMFFPGEGHEIEKEYLQPVLKSPRSLNNLFAVADSEAFCCSASQEQLVQKNHQGANRWIKKFETSVNQKGKPLPEVLKKPNSFWYEMKTDTIADLVTPINPEKRFFVAKFDVPSFINQRLIGLRKKNSRVNLAVCHALLNSLVNIFYIEAIGFGRGLGVLDLNSENFSKIFILDPEKLNDRHKKKMLEAFAPLLKRGIYSLEEELNREDRMNFEYVVLSAYGIEHLYERITNTIVAMQKTRLAAKK